MSARALRLAVTLALAAAAQVQAQEPAERPPRDHAEARHQDAGRPDANDPHAGHRQSGDDPHAGHALPADPHAGHGPPQADTHAGHAQTQAHPHEGHDQQQADPHAGHGEPRSDHRPDRGQDQPVTPIPTLTDADRRAAFPELQLHMEHPDGPFSRVLFNRFEWQDADQGSAQAWEMSAWLGGDLNRVWLRSEGEREGGSTHSADVELLYGRSVSPWWDVVAGLRQEFKPGPSRTWAAVGVQGLAPYRFEVQATALFGEGGRTAAALEVEYEMLLTNRLILQPLLEIEAHGRDDRARGIGSGLSSIEGGLRLRYEISRRFAPYLGVTRERALGRTADLRRAAGADVDETRLVAGVRWWF